MAKINFNIFDLNRLKAKYKEAVEKKQEMFLFDQEEILTSYAKYLIEYLEIALKDNK
jgi:hypothetical protein